MLLHWYHVNANYERIVWWGGAWILTQDLWISKTAFATQSSSQSANYSAMTYSSVHFWAFYIWAVVHVWYTCNKHKAWLRCSNEYIHIVVSGALYVFKMCLASVKLAVYLKWLGKSFCSFIGNSPDAKGCDSANLSQSSYMAYFRGKHVIQTWRVEVI